ncbi:carboxymuconolactone decarboxylase family protein [Siccirubricoccus sp. KC 17139]|uniref:Carboxymuconolactone decarboxylase family protein n=1 Tax=Siccirubricoccus soli TaxID=2899147 RepID=A0ABT1DD22_9PROT|nr:carboxymuconolactone decarboxylase family protein [Siccirubricoccus soli]MCO6418845.1 carboxymuconolactone decarboxylase family protein [Siccirubricoccus soli]MCP2684980.1 carboxymuconolactone decarboxylase family protein [Siccirubricoccus soli]
MSRLPPKSRETLDDAQRAVWDRIASGARGGVGGPFLALLTSAELCARVEQVGVFIRYECSVPMRLRELAILCVGQHWKAEYEWYAHAPIAAKQGVPEAVIAAIGTGAETVPFDAEPDRVVANFVREVLRTGQASDATYAAAQKLLGDKGTVELTGLVGYYTLLALQLNVFQVRPPEGYRVPWA